MSMPKKVIIIGEHHGHPGHKGFEVYKIHKEKPDVILYEGFTDASPEEIRRFVQRAVDTIEKNPSRLGEIANSPNGFELYIGILLKAMMDSGAKLEGISSKELQREFEKWYNALPQTHEEVMEYSEKLRENVEKTDQYMAQRIIEHLKTGKSILAILGKGHARGVAEILKKKGIEAELHILED